MIFGITHDELGEPIKRTMPVTGKIAIGRPVGYIDPETKKALTHPDKLDHFVFLKEHTQKVTDDGVTRMKKVWIDDRELTDHYGEDCTSIDIFFDNNDPESVLKNALEKWVAGGLVCSGNGKVAVRRMFKTEQKWQPLEEHNSMDCPCKFLEDGTCKPTATLYVHLLDMMNVLTVQKVTTSSYHSIKNLYSTLLRIKGYTCTVNGCKHDSDKCPGNLMGIPLKLVVRPVAANPEIDGKKMGVIVYAMHLEYRAQEQRNVLAYLADTGQEVRKLLAGAEVADVEYQDDDERVKADVITHLRPDEAEGVETADLSDVPETVEKSKSAKDEGKKKKAADKPGSQFENNEDWVAEVNVLIQFHEGGMFALNEMAQSYGAENPIGISKDKRVEFSKKVRAMITGK